MSRYCAADVAGRSVMHAHLQRLADRPGLPGVTSQVMPMNTDHRLAVESFIILQFGDDMGSIEHLSKEIHIEGETDTYQFNLVIGHRAEESPTPPESRELIVHSDVVYVEGLAGNFYIERTFNIHRYREISEHLREFALNPKRVGVPHPREDEVAA